MELVAVQTKLRVFAEKADVAKDEDRSYRSHQVALSTVDTLQLVYKMAVRTLMKGSQNVYHVIGCQSGTLLCLSGTGVRCQL